MGEPEVVAARLKYLREIHITIAGTPMPDPLTAETDTMHLFYDVPLATTIHSFCRTLLPSKTSRWTLFTWNASGRVPLGVRCN